MKLSLASLSLLLVVACTATTEPTKSEAPVPTPTEETPPVEEAPDPLLEGRPYSVHVPKGHDDAKPAALVFAFHGYGSDDDGKLLESFFNFKGAANAHDFLYIAPDGVKDKAGQRFWNGTDACCDFDRKNPDDVGYIRAVVKDVAKTRAVDPKRIYAFGLSGGGFFVHRLACEASDLFAGVVSMSAATYADEGRCAPKEGVAVVELHGEKDNVVLFEGGTLEMGNVAAKYPSAHETVARWGKLNGCGNALTPTTTTLDLTPSLAGSETKIERYEGCTRGTVELWTMKDGPHAPALAKDFSENVWKFFEGHPKP